MTGVTVSAPRPFLLAGRWVESGDVLEVANPADGANPAGSTFRATAAQYDEAVDAAVAAFAETRVLPAYERGRILREIAVRILARRDELARLITLEIGKPLRDAVTEVERTAFAFRVGGEEAERMVGETIPLDLLPSSRGRLGITRRFPIGPIAAISPFNLPLGLAVHKLAPAIATGNPIVLKPPSHGALAILALGEVIEAAGVPAGMVSILPMTRELGDRMVSDERFRLLTFTGSPSVGWRMKERAGKKKVVLELGGNAGVIVDESADLDWAVARCLQGSFKFAGQLCISVQRLFVHRAVRGAFLERFLAGVAALKVGDPFDPSTDLGPMIDARQAIRAWTWVEEAVADGATILAGGPPDGTFFPPTVLDGVPRAARICRDEAFAPVVVVEEFEELGAAIEAVNDSAFGLQAGVFTNDLGGVWRAFGELDVGGVIVNDIPTYRIDHMPYGGIKDSGQGREGLRWAMDDMTELRILVLAQPEAPRIP